MKPKFKAGDVLYDPFHNDIGLVIGLNKYDESYEYVMQIGEYHYYMIAGRIDNIGFDVKIGTLEGKR